MTEEDRLEKTIPYKNTTVPKYLKTIEEIEKWKESKRKYHREWASRKWKKNPEKSREISREKYRKNTERKKETARRFREKHAEKLRNKRLEAYKENPEKHRESSRRSALKHPDTARNRMIKSIATLSNHYVASVLRVKPSILAKHPELLEAKREQLKIHRTLKQCTRTPTTYQKSATILRKPPIQHGLTNLLSLELSSWSMPWVRQLTQLLLNSKPQN
jgi:hypothetical protein